MKDRAKQIAELSAELTNMVKAGGEIAAALSDAERARARAVAMAAADKASELGASPPEVLLAAITLMAAGTKEALRDAQREVLR